jgi:hypothetical protein
MAKNKNCKYIKKCKNSYYFTSCMDFVYLTCSKGEECIHNPDNKVYKDYFKQRDMSKEIREE